MKLAISNLAWDYEDNELVLNSMKNLGINNIEGVLTKIADWDDLTEEKLSEYLELLSSYNIKINSIQSLFFNTKCESISQVNIILEHFQKLINYSKKLSVDVLVFGTPSLRKKINGWENYLNEIFTKLDTMLEGTGIVVVIEPNTEIYGGEFFHNLSEINEFIVTNNLKNIKTMIDTHNLILEGIDPIKEIDTYHSIISHIHISEPELKPLQNFSFHSEFSKKLKSIGYDKIITYELTKCEGLQDKLEVFTRLYK